MALSSESRSFWACDREGKGTTIVQNLPSICHSARRQSHKTRIFSNTALITWKLPYFFTAGICVRRNYDLFFPMTRSLTGRRSCDPCGGRFIRSAPEISIVSLLTALCRGTFTLKAVVGSQSVMPPRRFVLRTMIVLHSGWILHYSIKPLTIQWRERGSIGQAACNLGVDRHVTFPGMLRICSFLL